MFHEANALAKLYSHESSNYQKVWDNRLGRG